MQVVATAGHVDHGKSTLIRALTGMEPDRWAEERRRGMTIDLGFAWTELAPGVEMAFVDVPGHERFVGNMLAGVGPVPAVLFVVAADEGWRPQSEEHLSALAALGVRHGLLAVTRSDLADPGPAAAEALDRMAGTELVRPEWVAVSGRTGEGLDELRAALARLARGLPEPDAGAPVRLWIDRAFTIRGSGTVVTGTLGAGTVEVGDVLTVGAGERSVQVRGLESLHRPVASVGPVARVAVNVRGVAAGVLGRGQALVTRHAWPQPSVVDVRLVPPGPAGAPSSCGPDRWRHLPAELTLHIGSAAVPVRVRPLAPPGTAGEGDTARLTLRTPLPLRPGDRALLRDPGRRRIAAGVVVLDVRPPRMDRRGAAATRAAVLAGMDGRPDPAGEVTRRGAVRRSDLVTAGMLAADEAAPAGAREVAGWLVSADRWHAWSRDLARAVDAHALAHPLDPALGREAARRLVGFPAAGLVDALVQDSVELELAGGRVRRPGARARFLPAVAAALDAVLERLAQAPFAAPELGELAGAGLSPAVLAAAEAAGLLWRVADGVVLRPDAPQQAVARLRSVAQPFTLGEGRQRLGTTRRVAVPLFEALDARGLTRRLADGRRTLGTGAGGT